MTRPIALVLLCIATLSACRLDVVVDVAMEPDGTGVVTLTATADAELAAAVPDIADELRLEDAIDNGWTVEGPTATEDGGLEIVLAHPFASAAELANVLTSVGPPLTQMAAARNEGEDGQVVNAINGNLVLADGYATFADAELVAAAGGVPFADQIDASGVPIEEGFSFTYRVALPGDLQSAETGVAVGDGVVEWVAPLDGSTVNLYIATVQEPGGDSPWAGPLATVSFVALVVWTVLATAFIVFVAVARRARRRRRESRLRQLDQRR